MNCLLCLFVGALAISMVMARSQKLRTSVESQAMEVQWDHLIHTVNSKQTTWKVYIIQLIIM